MAKATRRLARKRAKHALKALNGGEPPEEALHTARKDAKKLRALLKLIRPAFNDYKSENAMLRDSARTVSSLRDRTAMIEAFERLAPGEAAAQFSSIRAALEARTPTRTFQNEMISDFADEFEAFRDRARHWTLHEKGFDALEGGLRDRYRRARKAMKTARKARSGTAFHEWRKACKVHWYHALLLKKIAPDLMAPHVKLSGKLADLLGDHHDLVTLAAILPDLDVPDADRSAFSDHIGAERKCLERRAFVLGGRLFADKPTALARRWRVWWSLRRD